MMKGGSNTALTQCFFLLNSTNFFGRNCYSHLKVYKYTHNGIDQIACEYDIPDYNRVDYVWGDGNRTKGNMYNIKAAEKYILKIDC